MVLRQVHLIRHGHAEDRGSWAEPDALRPLSEKGRAQAVALADLDVGPATPTHSSPAERCMATIAPLAARIGVDVQPDFRLAEGADPREVVKWITSSSSPLVLCGHGDVLPNVLRLLMRPDMTLDGPNTFQKAAIWICTFDDHVPVNATYQAPPDVNRAR